MPLSHREVIHMSFIMQYLLHPRSVGAIKASSKHLAEKMIEDIDFCGAKCIVEIGAGTGAFTEKVVKKKKKETIFLIFEINKSFCHILREKFRNDPNLHIIHDSAEYIGKYLDEYGIKQADFIISGLPFASLPTKISESILNECRQCLVSGGSFITFQYTKMKMALLYRFFNDISLKREYRNMPPAYVMNCHN